MFLSIAIRRWAIAIVLAGSAAPLMAQRQTATKATSGWTRPTAARPAIRAARGAPDGLPSIQLNETEPNDATTNATPITLGDTVLAAISSGTDVDYYRVTLTAGTTVIIDVDATSIGSTLDGMAELFSETGTSLAFNDDENGLDPLIEYSVATTGTYFVKIMPFDVYESGSYRLIVRALQPGPGDPTTLWASGLGAPWGLAAAPGRMYVVDRVNEKLWSATPGAPPTTVADFTFHPVDVAIDPAGNLIVVGFDENYAGHAARVTPSGSQTPFGAPTTLAFSVTVGPDGDVWMGIDPDTVLRLSPHGVRKAAYRLPDFEFPADLAFSPTGVLHVSTVYSIYRLSGTTFTRVDGIDQAYGMAFDADGYLYVASTSPDEIRLYTPALAPTGAAFAITGLDGSFNIAFARNGAGAMTKDLLVGNAGEGPASAAGTIVRLNPGGVRAVGWRVGLDIPAILLAAAASHLMGAAGELTAAQLQYLDSQGNRNGRYDLGDFRAFVRMQPPSTANTREVRP